MREQKEQNAFCRTIAILIIIMISFFIVCKVVYQLMDAKFYKAMAMHTIETLQIVSNMGTQEIEDKIEHSREILEKTVDIYGGEILEQKNKVLKEISLPEYGIRYVFYGKEGEIVSSDGKVGGYKKEEDILRAWRGETVLSGPFFNEKREYLVTYIVPIYQEEKISGLLALESDGYCFSEWIEGIKFSAGEGCAYLINEEGTNIAVSREENKNWITEEYNSLKLAQQDPNSQNLSISELERRPLMGQAGSGRYEWEGQESYVVYAPISNTGWGFFVGFYGEKLRDYTEDMVLSSFVRNQIIFLFIVLVISICIIKGFEQVGKEKQEKIRIIQTLASMYKRLYTINLEKDTYDCIQGNNFIKDIRNNNKAFSSLYEMFLNKYVYSEDREKLKNMKDIEGIERLLTEEKPYIQIEYRMIYKGEIWWEHRDIIVISWKKGKPQKVLMAIRDVSEQKLADEKTADTLRDALNSAKAANEAKSDFLSRMSHDIRTPMNAIIGMTAIAGSNLGNDKKVKDCLKKISISSKHLLNLINEVLDMSKIESGKMDLAEEEFNLAVLVENLITVTYPALQSKNHNLKVKINDIIHEDVIGDPVRIQQIFVNLMSNAIKYTPDNGEISLSIKEQKSPFAKMSSYIFIFEDNGIGMEQEFLEHIYEPFSRAEDSRTSKIEGTGLGMAITQNIVRMMNGSIQVESKKGIGTKVIAEICLKLCEQKEEFMPELQDLWVLVADDDSVVCESTCIILEEIGMKANWVLTGADAVKQVIKAHEERKDYYAVIIDWKMPDKDGIQTAREIREQVGAGVPIIIISAYDWSEIEQEAREAGVDAFITKPLFKSKLVHVMQSLREEKEEKGKTKEKTSFIGKRLFVVEDNELNMEIIKEILESLGAQVITAYNGKEAVELFEKSEEGYFDFIFMDIQMPIMNGYEATRELRNLNRKDAKEIPIVAMTANAFAEDIQKSKNAGMNEHITKPLDIEQIIGVLYKYL